MATITEVFMSDMCKRWIGVFLSLALVFTLTVKFCLAAAPVDKPIKIGAIFSSSGIAAPHNQPLIDMVQLAVDDVNNRGGILGKEIQLFLFDNQSTPIGSAVAAKEAVNLGVSAVIGAHWSSHSLAIAPILEMAGIPMISPGSTNPEVTKGRRYIFRACFIDSFQGQAMAKFARSDLGAEKAVVVTNIDEDYSINLARYFSSSFDTAGGQILKEIGYRGNATDFSNNIKEAIQLKPDVIYLPGYTRDSGLFIRQAKKMGLDAIFLGGDAWDEIETYAGTAVNGSFQSAPWHPEVPFDSSRRMQALFKERHNTQVDNISSPLAYDAVMLLAEAIERAGNTDPAAIRDALAATGSFPGATGRISFDPNGDPLNKPIIIIEFKNNERIFTKAITP